MIIGICGGSGSGKTTLLKRLCEHFSDVKPSVFSMDNYYLPIEKQVVDPNGFENFDLPTALNREKLANDLKALADGSSVVVKEYHFNAPPDKNVLITIDPSPLIIVEGLFLFHFEEVRKLIDYSVFIKVDPDVQLDRRLYRDQETRGYSREAILYQWENHVKPCYENYLLPFEEQADFRFRNDANADEDFLALTQQIGTKMEAVKL
ncbi:MAG: uridine kinase [Crocinitomicaceae bacterium]